MAASKSCYDFLYTFAKIEKMEKNCSNTKSNNIHKI